MAEAARRMGYGHGSEVVRRLIARPIRLQAAAPARPALGESSFPEAADEPCPSGAPEAVAGPAPDISGTASNVDHLRTEMLLLKAVLKAERRENASLRACFGLDETDATMGAEARATRDRWAALVDRLLHAPV